MAPGRNDGAVTKGWTGQDQFGLKPDTLKVRLTVRFATDSPIWTKQTFQDAGTLQWRTSFGPCDGPVEISSDVSVLSASELGGDLSRAWDFKRKWFG